MKELDAVTPNITLNEALKNVSKKPAVKKKKADEATVKEAQNPRLKLTSTTRGRSKSPPILKPTSTTRDRSKSPPILKQTSTTRDRSKSPPILKPTNLSGPAPSAVQTTGSLPPIPKKKEGPNTPVDSKGGKKKGSKKGSKKGGGSKKKMKIYV
jgi:hypothetical protein